MLPRNPPPAPDRPLTTFEHELEAGYRRGYADARLGAGHRQKSIDTSFAAIDAFRGYTGEPPWRWTPEAFDRFSAELRQLGNSALTIRSKQQAIRGYLGYGTDPVYGWNERCEQIGVRLRQIVHRSNSRPHHRNADRGRRRNLTDEELTTLFSAAYAEMTKSKPRAIDRLAAQVWYAILALALAFATRVHEAVSADVPRDLPPASGATRAFSSFDGLEIWNGKAYKGGLKRHRFVPAIALFANQLAILNWYLSEVRPQLVRPHSPPALLLTTTGERFESGTLSTYFRDRANAAGLPSDLTFHCLRHTFATTLYRNGFEVEVIRVLLGHELQSTTMVYVHADVPFIQQRLLDHNNRLQQDTDWLHEDGDD